MVVREWYARGLDLLVVHFKRLLANMDTSSRASGVFTGVGWDVLSKRRGIVERIVGK